MSVWPSGSRIAAAVVEGNAVESLPRSPIGKVLKRELREALSATEPQV